MSGRELKNCPFCGDIPVSISRGMAGQPRWQHPNNDHCPISGYLLGSDVFVAAWNTRTPDPAQIRADAIRELAEIIRDWRNSIPMTGEECANDGPGRMELSV